MEKMLEEIVKQIQKKIHDAELIFVSGSYAFGRMQRSIDQAE